MSRIRIIKKHDEYTSEYDIGDIFEVEAEFFRGKDGILCCMPVASAGKEKS